VSLLAALLGHVDDVAQVERQLRVGRAVLDALVTLEQRTRGHHNTERQ